MRPHHALVAGGCGSCPQAGIESPEEIGQAIARALQLYPAEQLFLNPDCGFGTFSNRPVNRAEIACKKLSAIVQAVRQLSAEQCYPLSSKGMGAKRSSQPPPSGVVPLSPGSSIPSSRSR